MIEIFLAYMMLGVALILARMSMGIGSQPLWTIVVGIPIACLFWPVFAVMWFRDLMSKK